LGFHKKDPCSLSQKCAMHDQGIQISNTATDITSVANLVCPLTPVVNLSSTQATVVMH